MNEEIQNLINKLNAASDAYYNGRKNSWLITNGVRPLTT